MCIGMCISIPPSIPHLGTNFGTTRTMYHQCLLDTQSLECVFQNGHRLGG